MRFLKPLATTALSFAFLAAGSMAYGQQTTNSHSDTQSSTATDGYGNTHTAVRHHAKKTKHETLPDGTTVTRQKTENSNQYNDNGTVVAPPASTNDHTTTRSDSTVGPDGQTQTDSQTHSSSTTTNPPQN